MTLQYKLFETTNVIEVHYQAAPCDGGTHSAGIENQNGTVGLQYYLGTAALTTPLALRYTPDGARSRLRPPPPPRSTSPTRTSPSTRRP